MCQGKNCEFSIFFHFFSESQKRAKSAPRAALSPFLLKKPPGRRCRRNPEGV